MTAVDVLSREELAALLRKSDARGFLTLGLNWGMIAAALGISATYPNPVVVAFAMIVLAGRQLGLVILMHDCVHASLFASRRLNQFVGHWLCGAPLFVHLNGYKSYHLTHHQTAGSNDDPDLPNYRNYPVTTASFRRKVLRDLLGVTGLKNIRLVFAMSVGLTAYSLAYREDGKHHGVAGNLRHIAHSSRQYLLAPLGFHLGFFALLQLLGQAWLYAIWFATYLTLYMLVLRVRNAAEHAAVLDPNSPDPRLHTRTSIARWWERLTVAPNDVNYHLEHHLLPAVPGYRLAKMHALLAERGQLPEGSVVHGYKEVLRLLTSRAR